MVTWRISDHLTEVVFSEGKYGGRERAVIQRFVLV